MDKSFLKREENSHQQGKSFEELYEEMLKHTNPVTVSVIAGILANRLLNVSKTWVLK